MSRGVVGIIIVFIAAGCGEVQDEAYRSADRSVTLRGITLPSSNVVEVLKLSPLPECPPNPTNRYADHDGAALLGQRLFFDPRLSSNGEISCATCHQADNDWTDGKARSEGLQEVARHAPTLWNVGYQRWYFWDGRKDTLWSQVLGPIEHPSEMGGSRWRVFRLMEQDSEYRGDFEKVFGPWKQVTSPPDQEDAGPVPDQPGHSMHRAWIAMSDEDRHTVNTVYSQVGKSLEAYQRRLVSTGSKFDRFVEGLREEDGSKMKVLSDAALRGMLLFTGRGQCILCHNGPNFTDNEFHNIGLDLGGQPLDQGRYLGIGSLKQDLFNGLGPYSDDTSLKVNQSLHYVAIKDHNLGEFKTPTLRNISETAPYMHDGRFADLMEVVEFYSTLPDTPAIGHREESLQPLDLNDQEKTDLVAFLESLKGQPLDNRLLMAP